MFYVVRILPSPDSHHFELVADLPEKSEADRVADIAQRNDLSNQNNYLITSDLEALLSATPE